MKGPLQKRLSVENDDALYDPIFNQITFYCELFKDLAQMWNLPKKYGVARPREHCFYNVINVCVPILWLQLRFSDSIGEIHE